MSYAHIPSVVAIRAHQNVTVDPDTGCWVSNYKPNPNGYVVLTRRTKTEKPMTILAHRASWTHVNGQIPAGLVVDHKCFNRRCVNPEHLRLLTRRENSMRKTGDDWPLGTCKWGHPDSFRRKVYWKSRPVRTECSECRREANRIVSLKRKQKSVDAGVGTLPIDGVPTPGVE